MLKYKIITRKNPHTQKLNFHPVLVSPQPITREQVIARVQRRCSLTSADIKAALDALEEEIIDVCQSGQSIAFGDLGAFRPTISSTGAEEAKDVSHKNITGLRVIFRPSARIKNALALTNENVRFLKDGGAATPEAAAPSTAASSTTTTSGTSTASGPGTSTSGTH